MAELFRAELLDALSKPGKVAIFVGSGVSRTETDDPVASWKGLIENGIQRIVALDHYSHKLPVGWEEGARADLQSNDVSDVLAAAHKVVTRLRTSGGSGEYIAWLERTIGSLRPQRRELLEAILAFGGPLYTTNYDDLLEQASHNQLRTVTWLDKTDIERVLQDKDKNVVVHVHGHWRRAESVVLDVDSYARVRGNPQAQALLRTLRMTKTLLFVGFGAGLADPNFGEWLQWARVLFPASTSQHFRLARHADAGLLQSEHLPEDRIRVLGYGDKYTDLAPFLRRLFHDVHGGAQSADQAQRPTVDSGPAAQAADRRIDKTLERERRQRTPGPTGTRSAEGGPCVPYPEPSVPQTHYADRDPESQIVLRFLEDDSKRLLIVEGRSGLGKTALVCRVLEGLWRRKSPEPTAVRACAVRASVASSRSRRSVQRRTRYHARHRHRSSRSAAGRSTCPRGPRRQASGGAQGRGGHGTHLM